MELIPAIDMTDGQVVQLAEGDFDRAKRYGNDPIAVARRWVDAGARRLHLVDLDGARAGSPVQLATLATIMQAIPDVACQVAGGLRDEAAVQAGLSAGAARLVLGTALLRDPTLGGRLVAAHGNDRIVAALDVRDGHAVGDAWRTGAAGTPILEALAAIQRQGIRIFAVTAIARDGLLQGPDLDLLRRVRAAAPDIELIASGGIATIDDLHRLADLGADAAILGSAIYEGRIDLEEAIAALS
jgi:phosphoribosylformimino-5-aminoimidazole carboxamide ribotide isomerase